MDDTFDRVETPIRRLIEKFEQIGEFGLPIAFKSYSIRKTAGLYTPPNFHSPFDLGEDS